MTTKRKPPVEAALEVKQLHRSGLEDRIAEQLDAAGISYSYEGYKVPYEVPARNANYLPDFPITGTNIVIEGKGNFGAGGTFRGRFHDMKSNSTKERQKFALLKEQHPELDIRFVFTRAAAPIYKGSRTTHAKWSETHGFKWAEKKLPDAWIKEIQQQQKRKQ